MRTALFSVIMHQVAVISYQGVWTTYWSRFQGPEERSSQLKGC